MLKTKHALLNPLGVFLMIRTSI